MWKARNDLIFNNKEINQEKMWNLRNLFQTQISKANKMKVTLHLKWELPPPGWFKLNIDGASINNPGLAGVGGIIRNHSWLLLQIISA